MMTEKGGNYTVKCRTVEGIYTIVSTEYKYFVTRKLTSFDVPVLDFGIISAEHHGV